MLNQANGEAEHQIRLLQYNHAKLIAVPVAGSPRLIAHRSFPIPVYKAMKDHLSRASWNTGRCLLLAAIIGVTYSAVIAQSSKQTNPAGSISADKSLPSAGEDQSGNAITEEMRVKREIKFAEKEHRQNLERANEPSELGQEIAASFKRKNSFDREDIKKLDKLEKLAKRVRSEAGGSDDEVTIDKKPNDLAEAINCMAEVSTSLNAKVQETPRRVVSTEIIDQANVLLELIRIVRSLTRKV